jgi:hypothetical protein
MRTKVYASHQACYCKFGTHSMMNIYIHVCLQNIKVKCWYENPVFEMVNLIIDSYISGLIVSSVDESVLLLAWKTNSANMNNVLVDKNPWAKIMKIKRKEKPNELVFIFIITTLRSMERKSYASSNFCWGYPRRSSKAWS